ncbi:hypothetical protein Hanom_Chr16g01441591 [Helianthus anomalus]
MKSQDLGAVILANQAQSNVYVMKLYRRWVESESVKEDLDRELNPAKQKLKKTPDIQKGVSLLSRELTQQKDKVKSLSIQHQVALLVVAAAGEERDNSQGAFG